MQSSRILKELSWTDYQINVIKRGQIYFVSLNPVRGREQAGERPVLVVSDDAINALTLVVSVVVGTDAAHITRSYPTNVTVSSEESGLPKDTTFLCFQLRSLDPERFNDRVTRRPTAAGLVPAAKMEEVNKALKLVLSLK